VNDQIIEVDGRPLYGYNNLQAVDLLRSTGKLVKLKLARYLKGHKLETNIVSPREPESLNQEPRLSHFNAFNNSNEPHSYMSGSTVIQISDNHAFDVNANQISTNTSSKKDVMNKWSQIVGPQFDIIVSYSPYNRRFVFIVLTSIIGG